MFAACAGAALYRRTALAAAGGFDERLVMYLEDADLGLRLRLAGWTCRWEPRAVAAHAGEGSGVPGRLGRAQHAAARRPRLPAALAAARRLPPGGVGVARRAAPARSRTHLAGVRAALPLLPAFARERGAVRARAAVAVERVVPARPIRGPRAGGHPSRHAR